MKKTIHIAGIGLLLVSMIMVGCATMAPVQKTTITTANLSALAGKWQGWTNFDDFPGQPIMTTVEIPNSTIPLQGTITFPNVSAGAAAAVPGVFTTAGQNVVQFSNGRISQRGTLIAKTGMNFIEFTYYGGDKPKLDGWFFYMGASGTMSVSK